MKIKRVVRSLYYRFYIPIRQKQYKDLKYLFVRESSKKHSGMLIVSFSGFPGDGPARYNYINTLSKVNADRLFILDNFGYQNQGSYYLGENGDWFLPQQIEDLIEKTKKMTGAQKVVMIGSSKGGTSALYYAIKCGATHCVIGSPQYYLGTYLNRDILRPILHGIMGDTGIDSVQIMDCLMRNCICKSEKPRPNVYIHYSPAEIAYAEHIADLLSDLKTQGYTVYEDCDYEYTDHADVAKYFPKYLLEALKNIAAC